MKHYLFILMLFLHETGCSKYSKPTDEAHEDAGSTDNLLGDTDADVDDDTDSEKIENDSRTNIIFFIIDDYGVLSADSYSDLWTSERLAPTPTFNEICAKGVRFTEAWASPTCSPTRTNILTGRYSFRTGVGLPCGNDGNEIPPDEPTLPRLIAEHASDYALGSVGKWHLGIGVDKQGDYAPNFMGWEYYAGSLSGSLKDYFSWRRTENGVSANCNNYATTQNIDDAIAFLNALDNDEPFVLWIAFNAPHTPLHLPPKELHGYSELSGEKKDIALNPLPYYEAMTEAADTEMNRLLQILPDEDGDSLPDNTLIIVFGDNGTVSRDGTTHMPPPYENVPGKASLYEHGSRVPLCIAGTGVADGGRDEDSLVNVADLYATVLDAVGVDMASHPLDEYQFDSVSLTQYLENTASYSLREWILTEQFAVPSQSPLPSGAALKNTGYKIIRFDDGDEIYEECYNTADDPFETENLVSSIETIDNAACNSLQETLIELVCTEDLGVWEHWCVALDHR